jgi:hypothetical protein
MIGLGLALGLRSGGGGAAPPPAKTYADFVAHISTLSATLQSNLSTYMDLYSGGADFRVLMNNGDAIMDGSSWNSFYRGAGTTLDGALRHAFASAEIRSSQISSGYQIFIKVRDATPSSFFTGITRNGFTSATIGFGEAWSAGKITQIIRWDDALKAAFESDPSVGGAEVPYEF